MFRFPVLVFLAACSGVAAFAQPVDGALKWAFSSLSTAMPGAILSSPALAADGTVYFGVQVGTTAVDASGRVIAVTQAGAVKWSVTLPDWVDASPAVGSDGTVYVGCWDGKLYAFAPDGTKRWEYLSGGYIASSPAVGGDGTIYVGAGDFNLHAVNPDGTRRWLYPTADWVDGSPSVGADGTVYVGAGHGFYAVRPDGVGLWQASLLGGTVGGAAIAADGNVYVAARDGRVYAFAADGTLQWFFAAASGFDASPVLGADGTIYVGSLDGRMYALGRDGAEKWRFPRAEQPALNPIYSTAAVREDGAVVFGSGDNAVYALRADGTLLWKAPIGDWADSSPVIAPDGTIYVGSYDKKLYALAGTSGPAASDWPMFKGAAARTSWQSRGLPVTGDGWLANASVRARVEDASTLTVGFSVAGGGERELLVRGIGPGLVQFGVDEAVPEAALTIFGAGGGGLLAENRGWSTAPNADAIAARGAAAGAFPLVPAGRDAAALRGFAHGGYTAEVACATGGSGVVLTELYDVGGAAARLVNLSARTKAGVGGAVLTAGFVVAGGQRTLLIRGVGETLARFGVSDALADPRLSLFADGAEPVAENDNWRDAPNATAAAAAMLATGAFALAPESRDAALLVRVDPGAYTVQVSGTGESAGEALIEVYELR